MFPDKVNAQVIIVSVTKISESWKKAQMFDLYSIPPT